MKKKHKQRWKRARKENRRINRDQREKQKQQERDKQTEEIDIPKEIRQKVFDQVMSFLKARGRKIVFPPLNPRGLAYLVKESAPYYFIRRMGNINDSAYTPGILSSVNKTTMEWKPLTIEDVKESMDNIGLKKFREEYEGNFDRSNYCACGQLKVICRVCQEPFAPCETEHRCLTDSI